DGRVSRHRPFCRARRGDDGRRRDGPARPRGARVASRRGAVARVPARRRCDGRREGAPRPRTSLGRDRGRESRGRRAVPGAAVLGSARAYGGRGAGGGGGVNAWRRVLVLAPHTDDGEFGCGATMARLVEEGAEVRYVAFSIATRSL